MKFYRKIDLLRFLVSTLVLILLVQSVFAFSAFTDVPAGDLLELNETDSSDEEISDGVDADNEIYTDQKIKYTWLELSLAGFYDDFSYNDELIFDFGFPPEK